jgi:hypothetical protein
MLTWLSGCTPPGGCCGRLVQNSGSAGMRCGERYCNVGLSCAVAMAPRTGASELGVRFGARGCACSAGVEPSSGGGACSQ